MSTTTLAKKQTGSRRLEIIAQATRIFLENGYAGTAMSALARAAGITKASLYHHFPSKEDLFVACVTHGYDDALSDITEIVGNGQLSPGEKMRAAMECLYEVTITSPVGRMSPLIAEVSQKVPMVARSFHAQFVEPQHALIDRIVDEGVDAGVFRRPDRKLFCHLMFGPIVTLSLSREMFACLDDLDGHYPVDHLKDGHIREIMSFLAKRSG